MLPSNRRVKRDFFPEIIKKGAFLHGKNVYLRYLERKDDKPSLFSFIVPVKVKKTSVGRHLIKRKMSSVVEKHLKKIKPGLNCLFFSKNDLSAQPFSTIEAEILDLLSKIKALN